MPAVERFEDLVAWQKARELTRSVYHVSRQGMFAKDFGLAGQIQRAAVSAMSNVAEGFERKGSVEFHRFLTIAKASCAETQSLLYVALDIGYINQATFEQLRSQSDDVARVIARLRASQAQRISNQRSTR